MTVTLADDAPPVPLRTICASALDALSDLEKRSAQWTIYPNVDAMAVAALAQGARLLRDEKGAARWRDTAARVAGAWLARQSGPERMRGTAGPFWPSNGPRPDDLRVAGEPITPGSSITKAGIGSTPWRISTR